MAWQKIDQSFWTHRKTFIVATELDIHPCQAAGHIGALWAWALDNAPNGQLPQSDQMIAYAAHWPSNPSRFVDALVVAGYIDDNFDGRRDLHGWEQWTGALIAKRTEDKKRLQDWRKQKRTLPQREDYE